MLILASGSPRRKELLTREQVEFSVQPSSVEELLAGTMEPILLAKENALLKASEVAKSFPEICVLGADTVVVIDGVTLGKAVDLEDGAKMLRLLSGGWHEVVTGCALLMGRRKSVFHQVTRVRFRDLSEDDIANYHSQVEVLDKAGGYAIQEGGELIIAEVEGCRDNVMGLPVRRVLEEFAIISK